MAWSGIPCLAGCSLVFTCDSYFSTLQVELQQDKVACLPAPSQKLIPTNPFPAITGAERMHWLDMLLAGGTGSLEWWMAQIRCRDTAQQNGLGRFLSTMFGLWRSWLQIFLLTSATPFKKQFYTWAPLHNPLLWREGMAIGLWSKSGHVGLLGEGETQVRLNFYRKRKSTVHQAAVALPCCSNSMKCRRHDAKAAILQMSV